MKCSKHIRKLISFLTVICCLAGSMAPVRAAGTGAEDAAAVFTNEPKNSPDLYVSKEVEDADPERRYDQFQFVLKRGGAAAAGRTYRLYELDGSGGSREILKKDNVGNIIPFETDSTGVFTLEAGQRACFEGLGTGVRYEVIEQDAYLTPRKTADGSFQTTPGYTLYYRCALDDEGKRNTEGEVLHGAFVYQTRALERDGYSKVQPSGGTTGECTMPVNGDTVRFTNRYTPEGSGETAELVVSKSISYPQDWKAPVTEDFWFRLEIDKRYGLEAYANEAYTAVNTVTGETEPGRTASDGTFSLKGGWKAVFPEVPAGTDYKVYELLNGRRADPDAPSAVSEIVWPEGWWPARTASETDYGRAVVRQGSIQAPRTQVDFTNSNLSFIVTKRLEDNGKPDVDFAFRLTDSGQNGMAGKSYYLYKSTGEPVYYEDLEAPGQDGSESEEALPACEEGPLVNAEGEERHLTVCRTGRDGAFTLQAGQSAVFIGIEPGTSYRVVETGTPSYIQMLPLPEDSGKVYTVSSSGVQMLDFTNKKVDLQGTLTVLKQVQNETGEGSIQTDEEFHFVLYERLKTADELRSALGSSAADQAGADAAAAAGLADGTLISAAGDGGSDTAASGDAWKTDYHYQGREIYAPVKGTVFTRPDGLANPNDQTGPDERRGLQAGEFTLQAGKTASFERLTAGRQYLVREIRLTGEYREETEGSGYLEISAGGTAAYAQSAELTEDGLAFTFVNVFTPEKTDLTVTKTDAAGELLSGAEFMLYLAKNRDPENKVLPAELSEGVTAESFCYRTGEDGKIVIPDLKLGTYWLYETKAPHDYILLREPIEIQVVRTEEGVLQATVDGRTVTDEPWTAPDSGAAVTEITVTDPGASSPEGQKAQVGITVVNSELYELPNSGGMGIYWYLISGILLMMGAALILYKYQRQGRC